PLFVCVVLHELGHALMARRFGIETRDITLYPIGGVARLERMSERPWEELCIALAGPAVNVAIAVALGLFLTVHGHPRLPLPLDNPFSFLFATNVMLVFFNLLPIFPMDGGRVLRALLAMPLGHRRATEVAATLGAAVAIFFLIGMPILSALVGSFGPNVFMWSLVALFVFFAGQQELAAVRYREQRRALEPLEVLPADDDAIPEVLAVPDDYGFCGYTWDSRTGHWTEWRNGRPVHTISLE